MLAPVVVRDLAEPFLNFAANAAGRCLLCGFHPWSFSPFGGQPAAVHQSSVIPYRRDSRRLLLRTRLLYTASALPATTCSAYARAWQPCYRRRLCLASCQDFFRHHTAGLRFSASSAGSEAQHAKDDDALRLKPDLPGKLLYRTTSTDCGLPVFLICLGSRKPRGLSPSGPFTNSVSLMRMTLGR